MIRRGLRVSSLRRTALSGPAAGDRGHGEPAGLRSAMAEILFVAAEGGASRRGPRQARAARALHRLIPRRWRSFGNWRTEGAPQPEGTRQAVGFRPAMARSSTGKVGRTRRRNRGRHVPIADKCR